MFAAGKFPEAMEMNVNDDHVSVETIDSWRQDEIKVKPVYPSIPSAANAVQKKPGEKLEEMRAGNRGNLVPENDPGRLRTRGLERNDRQVFHALGVEVDFAMLVARETLEEFGERALCAMAPVHER